MKRHRVAIVITLIAILLVAMLAWLASHMSFKEVTERATLKGEAVHNPFYAAIKFAATLGADATWERVFTVPADGSVIVLSSWNWTLSRTRRERIERWVEAGGRLVVDTSLVGNLADFAQWSGIARLKASAHSKEEAEEDSGIEDSVLGAALIPEHCSTLIEDRSQQQFKVCGINRAQSLTSQRAIQWALRDGEKIEAVRTKVGGGSVTVINASPFQRREFLSGDHPALFVSATQLRRGDSLLLLTEEKHASLLTLVWRFGTPVVLLMFGAIALALWRATARFGPPVARTETARRSLAEQIRGTGQFALRFGGGQSLHAAAVRALRDAAVRRVPAYDRLSSEERIGALAKQAHIAAVELGHALSFSGQRGAHELRNAIAVLETARRRILMKDRSIKG